MSKYSSPFQKQIVKEGVGHDSPPPGSLVTVHYTGNLTDGTVFDSSKNRNQPFQFQVKTGQVIKGWDLGVSTMKKGEVCLLRIPPELGYGERGAPGAIPPNSVLIFEIELLDWN